MFVRWQGHAQRTAHAGRQYPKTQHVNTRYAHLDNMCDTIRAIFYSFRDANSTHEQRQCTPQSYHISKSGTCGTMSLIRCACLAPVPGVCILAGTRATHFTRQSTTLWGSAYEHMRDVRAKHAQNSRRILGSHCVPQCCDCFQKEKRRVKTVLKNTKSVSSAELLSVALERARAEQAARR